MTHGPSNLAGRADASFRGLKNARGGEIYVVAGRNMAFVDGALDSAGWDNRDMPLIEQFETVSSATNWSVALAFSEASARDLDNDGLSNTNEFALGTDHEQWDTDGDGMPDGYEVANSLKPLVQDGGLDKDTDTVPNFDEYVANTLANNPTSLFQVARIDASTSSNVLIHTVSADRFYTILFADSLTPAGGWNWQPFLDPAQGTWLETDPAATTHVFVDDFGPATSGGRPANNSGLRVYAIRVAVP